MKKIKHLTAFSKKLCLIVFILSTVSLAYGSFTEMISLKVKQINTNVTVSVRSQKNHVQFYMFNINGNLIKQENIKGYSTFSIDHLPKGVYLYDLFCNDERLKSGRIELK